MFDKDSAIGFIVVVLVIIIFLWIISDAPPAEPPKPKDDPDEAEQRRIAVEILRKNTDEEEVANNYGYDIEHVKNWVQNYLDDAEADHNLREALKIDRNNH